MRRQPTLALVAVGHRSSLPALRRPSWTSGCGVDDARCRTAREGCRPVSTARWVVVGAGGRVGVRLLTALDGQPVRPWTRDDADLTDRDLVPATLAKIQAESADPIICVNAPGAGLARGGSRCRRSTGPPVDRLRLRCERRRGETPVRRERPDRRALGVREDQARWRESRGHRSGEPTDRHGGSDRGDFWRSSSVDPMPGSTTSPTADRPAGTTSRWRSRPSSGRIGRWSAGSRRRRRRLGWTFGRRTRSWVCGAGSRPVCPNRAPGAAP